MTDLSQLIERVQVATEGSRELDILIGAAIDLRVDGCPQSFRNSFEVCGMEQMLRMAESHQNIWREALPRYTTSLDAVMSLMPEGYAVTNMMIWPGERASLRLLGTMLRPFGKDRRMLWVHAAGDGRWDGDGATPALALLAAILKAKQAAS